MEISSLYFVLLYYSFKSRTIFKTRVSFEICWFWQFQNTPYMCNLTKFWLRYLKLKTHDTILLFYNWFDWEENYWNLNILCRKQLIKHPRPFGRSSKDYSCWYWCFSKRFLEQNVKKPKLGQIDIEWGALKLSEPADFRTDPGFENCPRFVWVIE